MDTEFEKVVASLPSVGRVTKVSRTPRRARGLYVPPIGTSPRRSPRLLAKRRKLLQSSVAESITDSVQVPSSSISSISTPTAEALRSKIEMAQPQETVLSDLKHAIGKYQHFGLSEVKAVSGNISNYVVVCNTMKVDHELIGPHDAVRLVVNYNGKYKLLVYEKVLEHDEVDC